MTRRWPAAFGRFKTEQLRSAQEKITNAPLRPAQIGESDSSNRQAHLASLLARILVDGVQTHEQEINRLRAFDDLSDTERKIVREIFCLGFDAAEKEQRQDKMRVYRWLLARLVLNHTLDQPIPLNERSQEIPREVTGQITEPRVTQQSPKEGDTARQVRTASLSRRVFRYALCSIGVVALIWTGFAFRSPTDVRDAAVPIHDNQQDIARASARQEDRFEPVAHAGALTPPAAIKPGAEGASASMAEPARDSLPIYQTVRHILLRKEPRFGAAAQIMLDRAARLIVLEINGPWLKVKMENTGAPGFVREEWVVPADTAGPMSTVNAKRES